MMIFLWFLENLLSRGLVRKFRFTGIPLTLHGGRPSSRSSQRSESGGPLSCAAFGRRPSSGGSRGPLVPASRAGAARAAAILLISCHLQAATKDGNKHRRTLSDVAEGSSDGLGRRPISISLTLSNRLSRYLFSFLERIEKKTSFQINTQTFYDFICFFFRHIVLSFIWDYNNFFFRLSIYLFIRDSHPRLSLLSIFHCHTIRLCS